MANPKILIGCPISDRYEYCIKEYLDAIQELDYDNYDILLVDNSKEKTFYEKLKQENVNVKKIPYEEPTRKRIVDSRNIIRAYALDNGYDYFLSLEVDIMIKPNTIKRLLKAEKKIIGAYYGMQINVTLKHNQTGELVETSVNLPVVYIQTGEQRLKRAHYEDVTNKGIIKIGALGVGCLLIHKDVLKQITFRYEEGKKAFDDIFFCSDAKRLGYGIYIDSDIILEHKHKKWTDVKK